MSPVAVVTGAAQGIGDAVCEHLRSEGWEVVGLDIAPPADGAWIQADCADMASVQAATSRVPRIDALINNAAVQHGKPLMDTTVEEWDHVTAVNLRGPFVMTRVCATRLAEARGAVVNVASVHAFATSDNVAPYASAKAGLLGFTRAAAVELAPEIRVNAVVPGAIETEALREGFARRADSMPREALVARTPLRRVGAPQDVARAVAFLADGSQSSFMTGQSLTLDGGVLARLASE